MPTKDNHDKEFPFRGVNEYLDKVYSKIDRYKKEHPFSFADLAYVVGHSNYKTEKSENRRRLIRNLGFQVGDGKTPCKQDTCFTRSLIKNLYMGLHINPEDFLLDCDTETIFLDKPVKKGKKPGNGEREGNHIYFTRDYWNKSKKFYIPNPLIQVKPIPLVSHTETETDLTDFYEEIAQYYEEASSSIVAHEVLFKGNNNNPEKYKTYRHAQNQLFEAIDRAINNFKNERDKDQGESLESEPPKTVKSISLNRTFSYQRVFYLSPSESIHAKNIHTSSEMFKIMMIEASFETLQHIKKCFDRHSGGKDKDMCKFYVAPFSGMRAHTLIDDKILLSEDYKKHADYIKPHLIFIDNVQVKSDLQKMKDVFDLELKQKEDKKIHLLRKRDFPKYIRQAEKYLKSRIEEYEDALDILDGIADNSSNNPIGVREITDEQNNKSTREYHIEDVTLNLTEKIKIIINILRRQYFDVGNKREKLT